MIPKDIIDRIYNTAKIEEVVGDYVSLKRRGASLWGLCPFPGHTEKTPSFSVNVARNYCKCFGCGKGANPVNFIMEMEQCSYPEALRKLAAKYNIDIPEREMTSEEKEQQTHRDSMFIVNEWANKWYQDQLWNTPEGQAIGLSYFHERGLRDETIRKFQLGYSPAKGYLLPKAAREKGHPEIYLTNDPNTGIGTGICTQSTNNTDGSDKPRIYDRYHGRVIFPIHTRSGKTVGFAGRILEKKDNTGKYVNSPESRIYSKKNELYGLAIARNAIVKRQKCYLVEGQMDCISMSQAGIENVVCSGGTALTPQQIQLIHQYTDNVTILYDGDAAGIHAALRGIDMFLSEGLNVKVMLFPDGDDPDSFSRKHTAEEFVQYIADNEEDFIKYKTRTLIADAGNDLHKRTEAVRSIVTSISLIRDRIMRELYVQDCAGEVNVAEDTILREVAKIRKEKYVAAKKTDKKAEETPLPIQEVQTEAKENIASIDKFPQFKNVVRALIKYGSQILRISGQADSVIEITVGDYIQQYLRTTGIAIPTPLFERIFVEFNEHREVADITAFFINHPEIEISSLAVELISGLYDQEEEVAPMEQQILLNHIMHILYELHYAHVEDKLKECVKLIAKAGETHDDELLISAMTQQKQLTELKQMIAGLLGKC